MHSFLLACATALFMAPASLAASPAEVASFYAGHPVTVNISGQAGSDAAPLFYGTTFPYGDAVQISPDVTANLGRPTIRGAIALKVLLHEAMHQGLYRRLGYAAGFSESAAECAAVLAFPDALARFYRVPFGSQLSQQMWGWAQSNSRAMPPEYQGCALLVAGGA